MTSLYLDNDIVSKLASCDLLDEAITSLESQNPFVRILSTFKHRFGITNEKRRAVIEQQIGKPAFERIVAFQEAVREVEPAREDLLLLLDDLAGIDTGEAQLFAAASEVPNALVVTGDKRSLRCLAKAEVCKPIVRSLTGRVVCFEQVIKRVIAVTTFDRARRKIIPGVACDTALQVAFGMGLDAQESNVIGSLDRYIEDLRNETSCLLR